MLALHFPYCNHLCCNSSLIGYKVRKCTKKCISFDPRGVQQSTVTPIFLREDYIRSFEPCFIYQTWLRGIITNAIFVFENMRNQQKLTSSFFITFFYNGPRFGKTTTFKKKKFVHANFNSLHTDVFFTSKKTRTAFAIIPADSKSVKKNYIYFLVKFSRIYSILGKGHITNNNFNISLLPGFCF